MAESAADAAEKVPNDEEAPGLPALPPAPAAPAPAVAASAPAASTVSRGEEGLPPPPPQPHMETLPRGWIAEKDPTSGDTFYVNTVTDETTWDKPTKPALTNRKDASVLGLMEQKIETQLTHKHHSGWKRVLEEVVGEVVGMDTEDELKEVHSMRHKLHEFLEGT